MAWTIDLEGLARGAHDHPSGVRVGVSRLRRALALVVPVLLAACNSGESAPPAGGRGPGGGGPNRDQPTPVEVAVVSRGALSREATVAGALEPIRVVGVNAQLPGALLSVRAEEGDQVRAGQLLAEVDSREIAAQVRSAEASLELARRTAERSDQLFKDRIVTAAEYERDQAALAAAEASLDQLRTRLGFARVTSPITGVITEKRVEAGDVVQGQTRLFSVADLSTLVVRVNVSELDVAGIRPGETADVRVDAIAGAGFRGTVRRVFPAADTVTRMVPVEVAIPSTSSGQLKPGFMARVTFRLGQRTGVLLAPASAVVGAGDARAMFVVQGGRAERRPVRLGQVSAGRIEVLEGVAEGETVVVVGVDDVRDGGAVRVVPPVGASAAELEGLSAAPVNGAGATSASRPTSAKQP
jgi:membrane fusion protein (multidrug efflux system)